MTAALTEAHVAGGCGTCPCCTALTRRFSQRRAAIQGDADRQVCAAARERDAALSLIPPDTLAGTGLAAVAEMVQHANQLRDRIESHARQAEAARLAFVDGLHELLWTLDPSSAPYAGYPRARCVIDPADPHGGVVWHLRRILATADRAWRTEPRPERAPAQGALDVGQRPNAGKGRYGNKELIQTTDGA